jgi:glutamate racemase
MNRPIGIFDSGVGGLTVLQEIRRLMPSESLVYFGDTARAPYGGKDAETLISHGREIINFFLKKNVKAVVMACGTSSSTSYEPLRKEFPNLPIVDTIRPAVCATLEQQNQECVFIATAATIKSGLFTRLVAEKSDLKIHARACPLFAPMVEAGLTKNHPLLTFAAENYLSDLRGKVSALILGCTHYPLLTDALTNVLGEITFINPAMATAQAVKKILSPAKSQPSIKYYTSGDPKKFSEIAKYILNEKCTAKNASFK